MKLTRLFGLLVLCIAGGLAFITARALLTQEQTVISSGEAKVGGPFELTSHTGERMTQDDFAGKYTLMFFGYTFCPDICPAELQVISAALDQMGSSADDIQPVFVSIDPARDTVDVMKEYVGHFHPRLIGLTGSEADVARAAKAYRVYFSKVPNETAPADYLMDHSSIVYLMGKDGKFIKHFPYGTSVDDFIAGLKKTLGRG